MKYVVVFTGGWMEAQIVKGRLESVGIPVLLKYEAIGKVYGLTVDGLGKVEILVPEDLKEQALEELKEDEG